MTYRVVITAAAKQNLRTAYLWAAERAPETATHWSRFEAELESLSNFPERCALAEDLGT
jgi:plasmid stabilization system protein ParE